MLDWPVPLICFSVDNHDHFYVRMVNGENVSKMRKKWHIAFHGTKVQDIKPFLEGFAPFVPGKVMSLLLQVETTLTSKLQTL